MGLFRRLSGRKRSSDDLTADRDAFDKASSRSEPIDFVDWLARMVAAVERGDAETVRQGGAHYTTCPKCSAVIHAVDAWPDDMKRDSSGYMNVGCPQCAALWWKY